MASTHPQSPDPNESLRTWQGLLRDFALAALVAASYYAGARISFSVVVGPENYAAIWLPAGLLPAALLLTTRPKWSLIVLGCFAANVLADVSSGHTIVLSTADSILNSVESLLVALMLRRWQVSAQNINTGRSILCVGAAAVSMVALTSLSGAAVSTPFTGMPSWQIWLGWLAADGLSILIGVPLILSWANAVQKRTGWPSLAKGAEGASLFSLLVVIGWFGFAPGQRVIGSFPYIVFPLLIWIVMRFDMPIAALACALLTGFTLVGTIRSEGVFFGIFHLIRPALLEAQLFAGIIVFTTLTLCGLVDDKQHTEEALRQAEEQYRTIFENAVEGVFQSTPDGRFLKVNSAMARIFGYRTPDEMIAVVGNDIEHRVHADPTRRAEFKRVLEQAGVITKFEAPNYCRDGSVIWTRTSARAVRDTGGALLYYEGFLEDITERRQAEERLQESEAKYRNLVDNSLEGIGISKGNQVLFANQALLNLYGYESAEEFLQLSLLELVAPDSRALIRKIMKRRQQGKNVPAQFGYKIVRKDGTVRDVEISTAEVVMGGEQCIQSTFRDVTERKQAEDALRASEQKFRATFVTGLDVFYVATLDGLIMEVNDEFENIFGYPREEVIGKTSLELNLYENPADRAKMLSELKAKGRVKDLELKGRKKSGEIITCSLSVSFLQLGDQPHILGALRDITERKRAEEALRIHQSAAEQSPMSMAILDLEGNVEYANPKLLEAYQVKREDIVGKHWRSFLSASSSLREHLPEIQRTVLDKGTTWEHEITDISKEGEVIWREARISPIRDANGELKHTVYQSFDITERKRAEEALRESEERFRNLSSITAEGIMIHERGVILDANKAFADLVGVGDPEDLVGQSGLEVIPFTPESAQRIRGSLRSPTTETYDIELVGRNGRIIPAETNGGNITYHGRPARLVRMRDITERKQAEMALRESEAKLSAFMDSATDSFYLLDENLHFVAINQRGLEIIGKPRGEVTGKDIREIVPDVVTSGRYARHREVLRTGEPFEIEQFVPHPVFGDRTFILKSFKAGEGLGVIASDITERKLFEQALMRHADQLTLLSRVGHHVTSVLDVEQMLEQTVQMTHNLFNYDHVGLFLFDEKTAHLNLRAVAGHYKDQFPDNHYLELGQGIVGTAARNKQTFLSNDVSQTREYYSPFKAQIVLSEISVPILLGNTLAGVLDAQSRAMNAFGNTDVTVLETLAAQLAAALQNARLFEAEHRERTLAQVYQRAVEVMIEFDTVENALDRVAELLGEIVAFDRLSIMLVEDDKLKVVAHREAPQPEKMPERLYCYPDIPLLHESMSDVETIVLPGAGGLTPDNLDLPGCTSATKGWVGIPLVTASVVIGYMSVATDRPYGYSESDIHALSAFARQIVLALGQSHLLAQLEQSQARLTRLARLSAAGEVAAGVAHQINNPLTAVLTQAHLLMRSSTHDSEAYRRGSKIEHAALRAANVVERMLDLARTNPPDFTALDLNKSVADAVALVRPQIEPHIAHIFLNPCPHKLTIEGSGEYLLDVWLNLLLNAKDALANVADARIVVSLSQSDDGHKAFVRVEDNGPGIPPEQQARIFDPFVTTKPHGTGLGLSICHRIVAQHGGTIVLETPASGGASFLIGFPISHQTISDTDTQHGTNSGSRRR